MFKCPNCKKTNSLKAGIRKNKSGFVQKYFCNECKKFFINRTGFEDCQTKPEIIIDALDLRAKGMSFGNVILHLNQKYKTNLTRSAVLKWQNKFGKLLMILPNHFNYHIHPIFMLMKYFLELKVKEKEILFTNGMQLIGMQLIMTQNF